MKYEYAGGVMPEEKYLVERFEEDLLPHIEKHGGHIGELAMAGDEACAELIQGYRMFIEGIPEQRQYNYERMLAGLKHYERIRFQ